MTPPVCATCAAPLAGDQRYCLACGARRGPLPPAVAELIGGLRDAPAASEASERSPRRGLSMPSPRAAAVAVMGMLAFGVVAGSVVSPAAQSAGTAPVLVAVSSPRQAPRPQPVATPPPAPKPRHHDSAPAPTPAPIEPAAPVTKPTPAAPSDNGSSDAPPPSGPTLPPVKHVFLIVLSGHGYDQAFGADSPAPYLSKTLPRRGELLANYYAVAQSELANGIALISGQGPTVQTVANCPTYQDIAPATIAGQDDQVQGDGCLYPRATQTLADQLTADGKTWKAYVQSMGTGPAGPASTCRHPAVGSPDAEHAPRPGDPYVTWRNPFFYFHSVIDAAPCGESDVDLGSLARDLKAARTTPALSYVVPDACHDGADTPCAPGQPAGLTSADAFLRTVVPEIERSPGYRDGGLIAITFDEAPQTGPGADASSCCDNPQYPNLPVPTTTPTTTTPTTTTTTPAAPAPTDATPPGGGRVGLLLISPYVQPGSTNETDSYNHFSLLRSIEDLFSLDHLGYAADPALPAFDKAVYNASAR